ncbi:MAG TPA: hypothetical protein VJS69_09410 [Candidatus Krumholzibacteria bacterium]|nr:hypothetical protein [Candidatus Krumholzibacteria bacterium]
MPNIRLNENGVPYVRLTVKECELAQLYHDGDAHGPLDRGLGLGRGDEREADALLKEGEVRRDMIVALYKLAADDMTMKHAIHLLKALFRFLDKKTKATEASITEVFGLWTTCPKVKGRWPSEQDRLDHVMRQLTTILLDDCLQEWNGEPTRSKNAKTARRYLQQAREFCPAGSRMKLSELNGDAIASYITRLKKRPTRRGDSTGTNTIKRYLTGLTVLVEWLLARPQYAHAFPGSEVLMRLQMEQKKLEPSIDEKREAAKFRPYTLEELKRIVYTARGEAKVVFALQAATGMEIGAILDSDTGKCRLFKNQFLRHKDGPKAGRFNHVLHVLPYDDGAEDDTGKNTSRDDREVTMYDAWARQIVEDYLAPMAESDPFTTKTMKHFRDEFDRACQLAGVPLFENHKTHAFRHAFIERYRGKLTPEEIKQNVGHAKNSMLIYTKYGIKPRTKSGGVRPQDVTRNARKFRTLSLVKDQGERESA